MAMAADSEARRLISAGEALARAVLKADPPVSPELREQAQRLLDVSWDSRAPFS